ncbi:btb poz-like protein, partial [Colletotrichum sojae]
IKDACAPDSQPSPDDPPPPPPARPPVSPTGDVILLVGPESHEIRTHSLILANASSVFAAMLLGTYNTSEAAAVCSATSSEPAYIALPDDDPSAMETICRIVHCRTLEDECVWDMTPSEILKVAVLVDKYDCRGAVALAVGYWFAEEKMAGMMAAIQDGCLGFGRCDLLLAAWWLKEEGVFARNQYADHDTSTVALETKRNHLRLALQIILTERIHFPAWNDVFHVTPSKSSFWTRRTRVRRLPRPEHEPSSNVLRAIDHEVFSRGMPYMSISEAMRRAVEVPAAARGQKFSLGRFFRGELGGGEVPWHKSWMARGVKEFREKRVEGLCLACLHPQMRCERDHEGDGGRREWEMRVGMEGGV